MKLSSLLVFPWTALLIFNASLQAQDARFTYLETKQAESRYISIRTSPERIPALERRISVDFTARPVGEALAEIARRAGLRLTYSTDLIPDDHPVTMRERGIVASQAVLMALRGTSLDLLVAPSGDAVIVAHRSSGPAAGSAAPVAQTPAITGQVTDAASGAGLSGVAVTLLDGGSSAMTGPDGRYSIAGASPGTHRLRASIIGYAPLEVSVTVTPDHGAVADFALQPRALSLEGVVAIGYGTRKRSDVTGSIATIRSQDLERVPATSVDQALQGALPGVSIQTNTAGAEPSNEIQIRGRNSIRAGNAPLVVLDGIPYNGPVSEINQNDIASIDVLKDASSAAIYGARGANGVILITTKKGVQGKSRFSYSGDVGVQQAANIPRLMNGEEQAQWRCQLLMDGKENDCRERLFTDTELQALAAGRSTDWLGLAMRKGVQQQHNLSFSGGAGGTRFYIAGSILDQEGIAKNDQFQRSTLRVNLDQKVTSWMDLGTSTQLAKIDRSGLPASFSEAFRISPLTIPFDENGNQMIYPWPEDPFFGNPLEPLLVKDRNVTNRVISNNHLEIRFPFLEGLSYRLNGGIDFAASDLGRYYGRNTKTGLSANGLSVVDDSRLQDWTVENIVEFSREFGAHSIDLTGLYSTESSDFEGNRIQAQGFPNDVLSYYQANIGALVQPTSDVSDWRLNSSMGRLNYGYDNRYILTLTARRDGYSGFGRNHKYGVFPSVALAWNISDESFWPTMAISSLKLRASYGENGNQAISPYQTLARLREFSYVSGASTAPGFIPSTLANPDLKWETTTSKNFGADFGLFDERVRGSLDAYVSDTHDLLLDRLVSPVHGITQITENIGRVHNRGVELSLSGLVVDRNDFSWNADFNISANRNEITALYGTGEDDVANQWFIGKPIEVNYGYLMDGIWQLNDDIAGSAQPDARPGDVRIRDLDGDGTITAADRGFTGHPDPSYVAGLKNRFQYGGVSLDFLLYAVQGVTHANSLLSAGGNTAYEGRGNTMVLDYWTPDNPTNTTPANRFDSNPFAAAFYQDASFIRLKSVTLAFDIPSALRNRLGAEDLSFYITGQNLWTGTRWTGLDPELGNQLAIPLQRTFSAGTRVRF
jgi:TonB-linked SusC/RagA family outer membrane protein